MQLFYCSASLEGRPTLDKFQCLLLTYRCNFVSRPTGFLFALMNKFFRSNQVNLIKFLKLINVYLMFFICHHFFFHDDWR